MLRLSTPRPTAFDAWYARTGKAVLDRAGGGCLLVALAPLLFLVAVSVRIGLGRQVVLAQPRAGLHGRPFVCFKFRTMRPDRRVTARSHPGGERRSGLPSANDPRHTRFGTLLRRYSLDELPQLLNVVRGEMSVVGPRPELLAVSARYDARQRLRFAVKPGLTGYWQVTRRSAAVDLRQFAALDIEYASKVSLANDLRILWRTPATVLCHAAATECRRVRPPAG